MFNSNIFYKTEREFDDEDIDNSKSMPNSINPEKKISIEHLSDTTE